MTERFEELGGQPVGRGKFKGKLPNWEHGCVHTPDPWGHYLDSEGKPTGKRCPCCYEPVEETPDTTKGK